MAWELTRDHFEEFKRDYNVYGTHTVTDEYLDERAVKDDEPKATIHVMWQPMTDWAHAAEYGRDVERMLYCILYPDEIHPVVQEGEDPPEEPVELAYNDVVIIRDAEYEVLGLKLFNTYTRVDVRKKA